jgi:hypothetical protein
MLSDTEFSCVALCLQKKKKNCRWMKEWYKKGNKYTHENLLSDLRLSEPNYLHSLINSLSSSFTFVAMLISYGSGRTGTTFEIQLNKYCAILPTDDTIYSTLHNTYQTLFDSLNILRNLSI